jgi:serine-type D-Ala-D-Ala carboxypeptidase/endopeptidase (penicillin-binding protein 4)
MPASNQKLLTLAVAAERLGWDFTFETRSTRPALLPGGAAGRPGDRRQRRSEHQHAGDAAHRGTLDAWADALWTSGHPPDRRPLIGDRQRLRSVGLGAGWSWDDLQWYYASPVGALQVNENAVSLVIGPGAHVGAPAVARPRDDDAGLELRNQAWTVQADAHRVNLRRPALPGQSAAHGGRFGAARERPGDAHASRSTTRHCTFFEVASALERSSASSVEGGVVDVDALAWPDVRHAAGTRRPPLAPARRPGADVLMKDSQNLYAETLLRTLGRRPACGRWRSGRGAVVMRETLPPWGSRPTPWSSRMRRGSRATTS